MAKFKVGDRVRRIETHNADNMRIGDTGIVTGVAADGGVMVKPDRGGTTQYNFGFYLELITAPTITIEPGKHYRLRNGKVTGRVSTGDIGFEALVDGQVKVFDKAGGAVFGGEDIVEAWVPKVGGGGCGWSKTVCRLLAQSARLPPSALGAMASTSSGTGIFSISTRL